MEYEETLYIEEFVNNEMHNVDLNYSDFEISDIWLMIKLNNDTKIKEKYPDKSIMIVTHGDVCKAVNTFFNSLTNAKEISSFNQGNCEIKKYTY